MWFAFKPVAFDTYQGPVPFAHRENATSVASEKTPSLKFVFRADASVQIGTGHVMRCLTLADELSRLGHACWFLCREHQGHLGDLITSRGHKLALLSNPVESLTADNGGGADDYAAWLGVGWQDDAQQTRDAIKALSADWLIVDHYALDAKWERALSAKIRNIMVIDDLANRSHHCSILLDQNLGRGEKDYDGLVPFDCQRLIGPRYALLRREFTEFREESLKRRVNPRLKRILISLGGVDRTNVSGRVLEALRMSDLPHTTHIDVIMGASAPHLNEVRELARTLPFKVTVSVNVSNMAERMCQADLAIGAAGGTSWERCCLGLPSIVLVLADNQMNSARAMRGQGVAMVPETDEGEEALLSSLNDEPQVLNALSKMSSTAMNLIDGRGCERVISRILT